MTLDELKSELDLRGIDYSDCFSKAELAEKLENARMEGRADPKILDTFNNVNVADQIGINDDVIMGVTAKDGSLPGGMSPQMVKALASDPEIVSLLRDPKMQSIMRDMMISGPEGVKKYLSDPDAIVLLQKLSTVMQRAMPPPGSG